MNEKVIPIKPSTILILRPDRNKDRRDYENAFRPESDAFAAYHRAAKRTVVVREIDISKGMPARRRQSLSIIEEVSGTYHIDALLTFCHGWKNGIQLGFTNAHVDSLAEAVRKAIPVGNYALIGIYGCLTGTGPADGDGNFADLVRDACCRVGLTYVRVMGHTTAGSASMNPNVRIFDGNGSVVGCTGGYWMVGPKSVLFPKWKKALKETDLKWRFTLMDVEKVHNELVEG